MAEHFVAAFLDKLVLLEQRAGMRTHYRIMPPPVTLSHDIMSLQKTAKEIAEFAGITDLTFIIATSKQKEGVGGNIDLSTPSKDIFIEISPELREFPDAANAALCHEISHKWLQRVGIQSPIQIDLDNEILTDITGVFLGFGKIMLNGYSSSQVKQELEGLVRRTVKRTQKVGYLDRAQLAFVYCMACAMRKIPEAEAMRDLNTEASRAVSVCKSSLGQYFSNRYHDEMSILKVGCGFRRAVENTQLALSSLDKHIVYVRKGFCETLDSFIETGHRKLSVLLQDAAKASDVQTQDPALRFLLNIKAEVAILRLNEEVCRFAEAVDELLGHARTIVDLITRDPGRFPEPSPEMFSIVKCPKDGTKLRLPESSGNLRVRCPSCRYQFAYNTDSIEYSVQEELRLQHDILPVEGLVPAVRANSNLWQRLRAFARKKRGRH